MRDDVARAAALRALEIAREAKAMKSEKGDKGDPGEIQVLNVPVPGEQGPMGPSGPRGPMGPSGPRGFQGERGDPGPQGPEGKQGATGPAGASGKDGSAGPKGERGLKGDKGDKGDIGPMPKHERKGLMFRFEKAPGEWGEWIIVPTGGGGGGRDDKLTDLQKQLVEVGNLIRTQGDNNNKFIKTVDGVLQWDTLDGSDIDLASPPVIGNTTPNAATFTTLTATGQTSLGGAAGSESFRAAVISGSTCFIEARGSAGTSPQLLAGGDAAGLNISISSKGAGAVRFQTNGTAQDQMRVSHTASAVNYVQVTGAATTAAPVISAQGSDSNVSLSFTQKGSGNLNLQTSSVTRARVNGSDGSTDLGIASAGGISFKAAATANQVNYMQVAGSVANQDPVFSAQGSDTNISMVFQSKGTGAIDLAAGSSGVNISNGTTVTAITRTSAGGPYTSFPSISISAPTTAGGVQATADVTGMTFYGGNPQAINNAGSGYTVNDVLTIVGGTGTPCTLRVTAVNGTGGVTAAAHLNFNNYTVLPAVPYSVTGGTGTGATFTSGWQVNTQAITNAGSGYVEQPTVTFSGGGGSGAAAYATVGSGTTVRSLGSTMSFSTAGGEQFRVTDAGATAVDYVQVGGAANASPWIRSNGASTNSNLSYGATGNGSHLFYTAGLTTNQMRITHTASAVNYVQVTGAATGNNVTISTQGSDASVFGTLLAKGNGGWDITGNGASTFRNSAGANQFRVTPTSSAVNLIQATGAVAGAAPSFSSIGSDTNIGLNLTTKGTGSISLRTDNGEQVRVNDSGGTVASYVFLSGGSGGDVSIGGNGSPTNINFLYRTRGTAGNHRFFSNDNNNEQFRIAGTASAVNYVQVTGNATNGAPTISAQGSDANVFLDIKSKGSNQISLYTGGGIQFAAIHAASAVNYTTAKGAAAGAAPAFGVVGSDTNIDLALTPKGTGLVRFGTYTAGAPTATGYINIKAADGTIYKLLVST